MPEIDFLHGVLRWTCTLCGKVELHNTRGNIDHMMSGLLAHFTTEHPEVTMDLWKATKIEAADTLDDAAAQNVRERRTRLLGRALRGEDRAVADARGEGS